MDREDELKTLLSKIEEFKNSHGYGKVILFGSYSRGDFNDDSDVDLLIVDERFEGKSPVERTRGMWVDWHTKPNAGKAVDFLCYTPEEFNSLRRKVSIAGEADRDGIAM